MTDEEIFIKTQEKAIKHGFKKFPKNFSNGYSCSKCFKHIYKEKDLQVKEKLYV